METIETVEFDYYGEYLNNIKGITTGGLYYYLMDENLLQYANNKNEIAVPPIDKVIAMYHMPYLYKSNFDYSRYEFNDDLIKLPKPVAMPISHVARLEIVDPTPQTIGTFNAYNVATSSAPGGTFNWKKEAKCWEWPYTTCEIIDHISSPINLIPAYLKNKTQPQEVRVRHTMNPTGMYQMLVPGYKNDTTGMTEGVITAGNLLPTSSLAYTNYMANNQAQHNLNKAAGVFGFISQTAGGGWAGAQVGTMIGGPAMALPGAIAGTIIGGISGGMQASQPIAQERDLSNQNSTLSNNTGDSCFNYQLADGNLYLYRRQYTAEVMERIGWYFHQFGYAQNKVMSPDFKSRKYWNYIKTQSVNVKCIGIDKKNLEIMKSIFNNGVTAWHIDNGATVGDYTPDNEEV